jgi:hypothetical protein
VKPFANTWVTRERGCGIKISIKIKRNRRI